MALKGKKPEAIEKRLKCMLYGPPSVGKTTAAIQFPKPYLIDTERGAENAEYADRLRASGGVIFQSNDFDEIAAEIKALLSERHDYQTLVIDPITTVYVDLMDAAEQRMARKSKDGDGTAFGRHIGEANKQWRRLVNLIYRLDMNVIVTSHAKQVYGDGMTKLGWTFDGPKGMDYLFDLVFELQRRGTERVATTRKTRDGHFPEGETFPFSYDVIAERYGRGVLERASAPISLATPEQVDALKRLSADIDPDVVTKWLERAKAADFSEMTTEVIGKCIAWCEARSAPAV